MFYLVIGPSSKSFSCVSRGGCVRGSSFPVPPFQLGQDRMSFWYVFSGIISTWKLESSSLGNAFFYFSPLCFSSQFLHWIEWGAGTKWGLIVTGMSSIRHSQKKKNESVFIFRTRRLIRHVLAAVTYLTKAQWGLYDYKCFISPKTDPGKHKCLHLRLHTTATRSAT